VADGRLDLTDTIKDGARVVATDATLRQQLLMAFTEDSTPKQWPGIWLLWTAFGRSAAAGFWAVVDEHRSHSGNRISAAKNN
jgi:hypothetical protein